MPATVSDARRLAVLGSPIAHSFSPRLHAAAYGALGLCWHYGSAELGERELADFIAALGPEWRGLSLTMPLKARALSLVDESDGTSQLTGAVNTILLDDGAGGRRTLRGFNTDVAGIVRALTAFGVHSARHVWILGSGATAASALVAAAEIGAETVTVWARRPERADRLLTLGSRLGVRVAARDLHADEPDELPELVVGTTPGSATPVREFSADVRRVSTLLDVAYDPWPSSLASAWERGGGRALSGLAMLAQQALIQVRLFVGGEPFSPLPDEDRVLASMLQAIGLAQDGTIAGAWLSEPVPES